MTTTTNADSQPKPVPDGCQTGCNDSLPEVPAPAPPSSLQPPASSLSPCPQPTFPRLPGETPRAFSAFITWFQLGHSRSLAAVAGQLGEKHDTVKFWSSKYRWTMTKTVKLGLFGVFGCSRVHSGVAAPSHAPGESPPQLAVSKSESAGCPLSQAGFRPTLFIHERCRRR